MVASSGHPDEACCPARGGGVADLPTSRAPQRTRRSLLVLLLQVLGAAAMVVVALRTGGEDRLGQALAWVAAGCLCWAAVVAYRQDRPR